MQITNLPQNVPAQVKNLFYSIIPFGSDYVIFTSSYSVNSQVYDLYFAEPITHTFHHYTVTHQSNSEYVLNEDTSFDTSFDGFSVSYPYYCYSSSPLEGIIEKLPCVDNIICFSLIVVSLLCVLKVVFGGIRLWSSRREYRV